MRADRGAAPVARMEALPPAEAALVHALRLSCSGDGGRERLSALFGAAAGAAFDGLMQALLPHLRRPLMHHATRCACVGADEAVFANFVVTAAWGEREDAMLMATLLVRADAAPGVVALAEMTGHHFGRACRGTAPAGRVLH